MPDDAETRGELRSELRALLRLSLPLIAAQEGAQLMSLVDTAMVGRLGAAALGGTGVGNGIYFSLGVVGFGCVMGMDPLAAQAIGAGEEERARRVLWQGIRVAVLISIPIMMLLALAPSLVAHAGMDAPTAHELRRFLYGRMPNMVPMLIFGAQRAYLQARGATRPIVAGTVVANLVNVVGNALLIYGDETLRWLHLPAIGLPALGVMGSGLSSTIATTFQVVIMGLAIRALPGDRARRAAARAERSVAAGEAGDEIFWRIVRLGMPLGLQLFAEVSAFAIAAVLVARFGAAAAAGNTIAINLASVTFHVTVGIGAATAVRVGRHVGEGRTGAARRAGFLGIGVGGVFMACSAAAFLLFPAGLVRLLTDDRAVIAAAVPLMRVAAIFQLSDGAQAVAAGALRGAGDTMASFVANVLGHYLVGLPVAMALGFAAHLGAVGLWWGLSAGLTAVGIALTLRFARISSRPILRV